MQNQLKQYSYEVLKKELLRIWPNIEVAAYALYDSEKVYLFHHPNYLNENDGFKTLPWTDQFAGSTVILFDDYPTAIDRIENGVSFEKQLSILAHELFHAYQYLKGEKRFPNEMLGITYPLIKENMELRIKERLHLFSAVKSNSYEKMIEHLETFITIREHRKDIIGEYFTYETNIETVEGPAFYVEYHTYVNTGTSTAEQELDTYKDQLLDPFTANESIRKASYSSGLLIAICLDRLKSDWKEILFQTDLSLYDLLKRQLPFKTTKYDISYEEGSLYEAIINKINYLRTNEIIQFLESQPYQVSIKGNFKIKGFDPMNIITSGNHQLHKNFLSLETKHGMTFIQQPVVTYFKDSFLSIEKIHFSLPKKPVIGENYVLIDGVGKFEGTVRKINDRKIEILC